MTKKRWIALLSAIGIVVAAALTTAAVTSGGSKHADDSPLVYPSTTPSTRRATTTSRATTTTVDVSKLAKPIAPPSDPYAPTPIVQIGVIEIPKINEISPIFEGITLTVIDHGPGHWPGSSMPCGPSNTVFPGHRVTHSHPFLNLDLLSPGDQIVFHMPGHDCVYKVSGTQIVRPTDVWVTNPTPTPTVTLIACHPKHSAAERIVVKGYLAADIPRPA
ncbi:MAG TPA: class E sortase [Acidimicrobiia bacterium]|nr:class E sortase [Acidimicrobiia bacterium]